MKYLPIILISLIAIAAAYFLYYKPKQEKDKADNDAAIAANDAALLAVPENKFLTALKAAPTLATSKVATVKALATKL